MARFPINDIMTLTGPAPEYDLAESTGPNLLLHEVLGTGDVTLGYGTASGDPRLRAAIAARHGVDPDDVVVTAGGMHALFLLAFILCAPGDEVVAIEPQFPLARTALATVGAQVRSVRVDFDHGYQPQVADIAAQLTEQTKLVSLASPQNPSGVVIPPATLRHILQLMQERCPQAFLLVDETYREAVYGEDQVATSALDLSRLSRPGPPVGPPSFGPREPAQDSVVHKAPEVGLETQIISVASLSKCHGAPGLRIGWAITRDHALRDQLAVGKFSTVISCSAVDEALALHVLAQDARSRRAHLAAGLARIEAWVGAHRRYVEWVRPDAGALCCVRLRRPIFPDLAIGPFFDGLAERGIRVARGSWFGDEDRVFRLGFGLLALPDLDIALAGLSAALRKDV